MKKILLLKQNVIWREKWSKNACYTNAKFLLGYSLLAVMNGLHESDVCCYVRTGVSVM